MAHLSGDDRGQLMLVGSLALAVVFVSFAFLLNTAIYTETIASRGTGVEADNVVGYRTAAGDAAGGTVDRLSVGRNATYASLHDNLTAAVGAWDAGTARHYAKEGDVPSATLTSVTDGTRIVQNGSRNFTDATTATDWTLASDVLARNFTMTVEGDELVTSDESDVEAGNADGAFNVTFRNATDTYAVHVYESSDDVTFRTVGPGGTTVGSCTRPSGPVEVDFSEGTVNGTACAALDFYRTFEGEYDVRYANADEVSGTYSLTVDDRFDELQAVHFTNYGGDGPFRSTAVYAVDLEVVYRSASVYYRADLHVAPNAPGVQR